MKTFCVSFFTMFIMMAFSPDTQGQSLLDWFKGLTKSSSANSESNGGGTSLNKLTSLEISGALKEALNIGIEEGINKLGAEDGFFRNELVKILLPEQLQSVDKTLRAVGMGSLADEGIKLLNRAAEDAVKEGVPIFANAITSITFEDAKEILTGDANAATTYLQQKTSVQLFEAFMPKVSNSLGKVGADKVWEQIISRYNTLTRNTVNPNLNEYVTSQAIEGVFHMVAEKEKGIRDNEIFRTTALLQKVFGALD